MDATASIETEIHTEIKPAVAHPVIDKISLTLSWPDEQNLEIEQGVQEALHYGAVFQHARSSKQYKQCRNICLPDTAERVHFSVLPRTSGIADCRFELNPAKLGFDGIKALDHILTWVFPSGWDVVVEHAKISRIDIAIDLQGIVMDQFIPLVQNGTWRTSWRSSGHLHGLYFGQAGSNQWKIYDKYEEQKSKGILLSHPTVRIERSLRNTQLSLQELKTLPNPFKKIVLLKNMPGPPEWEDAGRWQMFCDAVLVRGLNNALGLVNSNKRAKYKKYLKECGSPWWEPDKHWSYWPSVVADLL